MTQEDKQLLLVDLCGRLPYGVKVTWNDKHPLTVTPHIYCAIASENKLNNLPKLLLRPMSSMTADEVLEYISLKESVIACDGTTYSFETYKSIDWLNKKMFDYRGLIPKDLALSTDEFNPYKDCLMTEEEEIVRLLRKAIELAGDGGPQPFIEEEYDKMYNFLNRLEKLLVNK